MAFSYVDGQLARLSLAGSPQLIADIVKDRHRAFYLYDLQGIGERVRELQTALSGLNMGIHYAVKANHHPEVIKTIAGLGCGVDVVSGGELNRALEAGVGGERIVFSGVGKSRGEIELALRQSIFQINVESPQELERIAKVGAELGLQAPVAFRMNPDVSPDTHPYIKTGFRDNKFGMDEALLPELFKILKENSAHLKLMGLTMHIGSQLRELSAVFEAVGKIWRLFEEIRSQGFDLQTLDVGGGLGIDYHSDSFKEEAELMKRYGQELRDRFSGERAKSVRLLCEPGRILVARFGLLLTQVEYVKRTPYKNFAIVNSGMHHLLRPALYQAQHRILPLSLGGSKAGASDQEVYDVVGPICESADVLGFDRRLPRLDEGDWLAVADCGAYGAVMASQYNLHELPEEVVLS